MERKYNQHSVCHMNVNVREESINDTLLTIDRDISVIDDDKNVVFTGFIYDVNIMVGNSGITEITAYSNSMKADVMRYSRIFQNPGKKLSDIISLMNSDSEDDKLICDINNGCDKKIEYPVIQDNETNYEFVVRLACECGLFVMASDADKPKCIIFDGSADSSVSVDKNEIFTLNRIWRKNPAKNCSVNGIIISLGKLYEQGTALNIKGDNGSSSRYNIYDVCVELISAKYFYKYTLFEKNNFPQQLPLKSAERIYLEAEVTENNDKDNYGRIQVKFIDENFRDMDSDEGKVWIQWRSPYTAKSGGFVFLPEKNDVVEVIYSRKSFIAGNSLRKKSGSNNNAFVSLSDDFSEPHKNKYIAYLNQKRISFTDKEIIISYGDNTLTMNDEKIIITVGKSTVSIDSDCISLDNDGNSIVIKKDDISLKCGNSVGMQSKSVGIKADKNLKLNSDSKIDIKGSGEVAVSASKISLK